MRRKTENNESTAHYPSVVCGAWESYMTYVRWAGRNEESRRRFLNYHREPFVRRLHRAGVTVFMTHFCKGFGLDLPEVREELRSLKGLVSICHRYGIKVGGYVGNGLVPETLKLEEPDCETWLARDRDGRTIPYSWANAIRLYGCRNNPRYRVFIKKMLRAAVMHLGLDIIHLDHVFVAPAACYCVCCRKDFKEYLEREYPSAAAKRELLGHSDWRFVEPPPLDMEKECGGPLNRDALLISWIRFQAQRLSRNIAELAGYIKKLNPAVQMALNCAGINSHPLGHLVKVDLETMLSKNIACFFDESGGEFSSISAAGGIRSHLRSLKVAQSTGKPVWHYTGEVFPGVHRRLDEEHKHWYDYPGQRLAEALAMNRNSLGVVSLLTFDQFQEADPRGEIARYSRFLHEHQDLYAEWTSLNRIAVWRSADNMLIGGAEIHVPICLVEQALIEQAVPFDLIMDRGLKNLKQYRVLIVPAAEIVAREEEEMLSRYVRAGNSLVLVGYTGAYNRAHQIRRQPGFRKLLKTSLSYDEKSVRLFPAGRGRVLFISPAVLGDDVKFWTGLYRAAPPIYHDQWKAPESLADLKNWLSGLDKSAIPVEIEMKGNGKLFFDLRHHPLAKKEAVHLVRYVSEKDSRSAATFRVRLRADLKNEYSRYRFIAPGGVEKRGLVQSGMFACRAESCLGGVIVLER